MCFKQVLNDKKVGFINDKIPESTSYFLDKIKT